MIKIITFKFGERFCFNLNLEEDIFEIIINKITSTKAEWRKVECQGKIILNNFNHKYGIDFLNKFIDTLKAALNTEDCFFRFKYGNLLFENKEYSGMNFSYYENDKELFTINDNHTKLRFKDNYNYNRKINDLLNTLISVKQVYELSNEKI